MTMRAMPRPSCLDNENPPAALAAAAAGGAAGAVRLAGSTRSDAGAARAAGGVAAPGADDPGRSKSMTARYGVQRAYPLYRPVPFSSPTTRIRDAAWRPTRIPFTE